MTKPSITYSNPVLPGFYPDPSIARAGDDYYLICSSFEYFPGVPIFHSRDLIHWEQIGHVLDRPSQLNVADRKSSDGIYAPTLRYHDGTFYMITTDVRGIGNFYVTATNPAGPWSDPILVPYGGIDPSLFFDDDGKVYVTAQQGADYDSHAIQYEIDIATGKALSEPVVIWRGDGGPWTEGPHLYKIGGKYYIMTASGGTAKEHREIIGRGSSPYGPFELYEHPILTHRGIEHPIQYLGHADLVEDGNGDWWAVFLGVRLVDSGYSVLGRETFLAPVIWNEEDWPMIDNNEGTVNLEMRVTRLPGGSSTKARTTAFSEGSDDFDKSGLSHSWTFLRNPAEGSWSLEERPGWLTLRGQSAGLSDVGQVAFVGRRQQHVQAEWSTYLDYGSIMDGEEAGICARRDEDAHYEIFMKQEAGLRTIGVRLTVRGEWLMAAEVPTDSDGVYLKIRSDVTEYSMYYSLDGQEWIRLSGGPARALAPEDFVNKMCFTGIVIGLYASGNGKIASGKAHFDWFVTRQIRGGN
ncbi:glycoside hydrolase family 43 protein [Paenibacillus sp. Marseille-P2973]|uniref:glycoside hydrolase family 43 protein n=1 Tax=Paenibacillus sp. Marseille-P2973 TaxID=1871032 RepID=UPI001B38BFB9|nr:glycoside hydrolase family 43 protein [Paenibacillus sp. Marseille-P2973]MBQ4900467.1 glycoside hydrolase family 43 protein [Paenibacillus sp. Marseille-P2973]